MILPCAVLWALVGCVLAASPRTLDVLVGQQPSLSVFLRTLAAQSTDLMGLLRGVTPGQFTVFAPTNDAISAYGGFFPSSQDLPRFQEQLRYHVAPGIWSPQSWDQIAPSMSANWALRVDPRGNSLPSSAVLSLTSLGGILAVNQILTNGPPLTASNGLLYIIDKVLDLPGAVSITAERIETSVFKSETTRAGLAVSLDAAVGVTVFVPVNEAFPSNRNYWDRSVIDSIRSMVVMQVVYALDLSTDLKNILGDTMVVRRRDNTSRELFVGNCRVLVPNIITRTGVIHLVDSLFVPKTVTPTRVPTPARAPPPPPGFVQRPISVAPGFVQRPISVAETPGGRSVFVIGREAPPTPQSSNFITGSSISIIGSERGDDSRSRGDRTRGGGGGGGAGSGGYRVAEAAGLSPADLKALVAQPNTQTCIAACMGSVECVSHECSQAEWGVWDSTYQRCLTTCVLEAVRALSPNPPSAAPSIAPTRRPTLPPSPAPTTCLHLCIGDTDCLTRPCSSDDWEYYSEAYAVCKEGCGLEADVSNTTALFSHIQMPSVHQARLLENCMGGIDCRVCSEDEMVVWTAIYASCWKTNVGLPVPTNPRAAGLNPFTLTPLAPRAPRNPPTPHPTIVGATPSPTIYCVDACVTQSSNGHECPDCTAEDREEFQDTTHQLCSFVCKYIN